MKQLRVVDLFCGAGGFSEGFRQAGFRVTQAIDLWPPAVETHRINHPETEVLQADLLKLDPNDLAPFDVLIGSPPCTEFSFANRGGSGDIEKGMELVYRFLRFVYELEPRWWVMENVPRVLDFLPDEIPLKKLGVRKRGSFEIPVRALLISADFGVPQKRARAFSGNFPVPKKTHAEVAGPGVSGWRRLREVVEALPDPLVRPQLGETVRDPTYDFELLADDLTDHFTSSVLLTDEEVRENRAQKVDHAFYGRMSFPDELDRPARTVMATQLRVARETTVIPASSGGFRRLTVRESSSVQAFPITYQWWGRSQSLRYKLVGNAVAPPVAAAVARAILADAKLAAPARPYVLTSIPFRVPEATEHGSARRGRLPLLRRFRQHIPGSRVPGYRVEIDNEGRPPMPHPAVRSKDGRSRLHLVEWQTSLYRGSGKAVRHEKVDLKTACDYLAARVVDDKSRERVRAFATDVADRLGGLPDATTMQGVRAERIDRPETPYRLVETIAGLVDRRFESAPRVVPLTAPRGQRLVPLKTAATLVAGAFACEVMNRGRSWLASGEGPFVPDEWTSQRVRLRRVRSLDLGRELHSILDRALRRSASRRGRVVEIEQLELEASS